MAEMTGITGIPAPGTPDGPCADDCRHTPCGRMRIDAATRCALCRNPIGYETPWRVTPLWVYLADLPFPLSNSVHTACLAEREKEQEQDNAR